MLTYRVRKHVYKSDDKDAVLLFPNSVTVRFHLRPLQPFGVEAGGGRTAVRSTAARAYFNANSGQHFIESKNPLTPLDVRVEEENRRIELKGNTLTVTFNAKDDGELDEFIQSIFFGLPMLLNLQYADPPLVIRVSGTVGTTEFRWELADWKMGFATTTQQQQEQRFIDTWSGLGVLSAPKNRRLIAALHYFHVACRLERLGEVPGEFLAEVLLNLSKVLEVLFPPGGDGKTRDAVRAGLQAIGLDSDRIERYFIPAMALRNEIDVGHVHLALFKPDHLRALHSYTEGAETAFRKMLKLLFSRIRTGEYDCASPGSMKPSNAALTVIERLAESLSSADEESSTPDDSCSVTRPQRPEEDEFGTPSPL